VLIASLASLWWEAFSPSIWVPDRGEPLDRVGDPDGELRDHDGDLVVGGVVSGGADRDRHQRAQRAGVDAVAAFDEEVAEGTRDRGEDDVVDGAAEGGAT
jgi:hypothetical protein